MANKQTIQLLNHHDRSSTKILSSLYEGAYEFSQQVLAPLDPPEMTEAEMKNGTGETCPDNLFSLMGEAGLLAVNVPKIYGGIEAGFMAQMAVTGAISRFSGSFALSELAHVDLAMNRILKWGTEAQKQEHVRDMASGKKIGALAMSEQEAGTHVSAMKLKARKVGSEYVLDGHKTWITNGGEADVIVLYAVTDPDAGNKSLSAFIFDANTPGFVREKRIKKGGMKRSNTWTLVFNECVVSEKNMLGARGEGLRILMNGLATERAVLACAANELGQHAYDFALDYDLQRIQFGKAILDNQAVQFDFANMQSKLLSSRGNTYQLAAYHDNGTEISSQMASATFLEAGTINYDIASECVEYCGGSGYTTEFPLMQIKDDAMLYRIGGGTRNARRISISKDLKM